MPQYTVQIGGRGIVALSKKVRQRYGFALNMPLTLVDWDGILIVSFCIPVVAGLAGQVAAERAAAGIGSGSLRNRRTCVPRSHLMPSLRVFLDADVIIAGSASLDGASHALRQVAELVSGSLDLRARA